MTFDSSPHRPVPTTAKSALFRQYWTPWRLARLACEVLLVGLVVWLMLAPPRTGPFWRASLIHAVPVTQPVVALTYDDGPHPVFTPQLLMILQREGVRVTFFMVGKRMEAYPDLVRRAAAAGHVIGNHSYSHPHNMTRCTETALLREIERTEEIIERLTGQRSQLFRPPRGSLDGAIYALAGAEGYQTICWSVSGDHHEAKTPAAMAARVLRGVHPGSIILLHDGNNDTRWKDIAATPLIIDGLRARGYRCVTVPELLARRPHAGAFTPVCAWVRAKITRGREGRDGEVR